jgi:murein L,D-transpeptidase YafK
MASTFVYAMFSGFRRETGRGRELPDGEGSDQADSVQGNLLLLSRQGEPMRWKITPVRALPALFFAFGLFSTTAAPQAATQPHIDSILILKKDHLLELLANGKAVRTYKVALGQGGLAPKRKQGDGLTPEGQYVIDQRNASSHYHKALHVSYPDAKDRRRAAQMGVSPGGDIMIHGLPNGRGAIGSAHRLYDWTLGCIAVTDEEIDSIWELVPVGTPVEIRP